MSEINYLDAQAVIDHIKALVPCRDMQNILFDRSNGVDENIFYGHMNFYMRNIITMSFVLVYTRWKQVYKNEDGDLSGEKLERFKSTRYSAIFESIDKDENLNLDIMVFALIEVWVGMHVDNDLADEVFNGFFRKRQKNFGVTLQKALKFAYTDEFEMIDAVEQNKLICEVLSGMAIFDKLEMSAREERKDFFDCRCRFSNIEVIELCPNKWHDVKLICHKGYFDFMERNTEQEIVSQRIRPYIICGYSKLENDITYSYRTFDEQYYKDITISSTRDIEELNIEQQKLDAINQLLAFNYKKLRDFSLVICDSINKLKGYKRLIFNKYKDKYRTIFPDGSFPEEDYLWDNIITLLLVELGPTEFLQSFIDVTIFDQIMVNIKTRYMTENEYDEILRHYKNSLENLEKSYIYQQKFKDIPSKKLMAITVVSAMHKSDVDTINDIDFGIYEESLATKYDKAKLLIDKLKTDNKLSEYSEAQDELQKTLEDMLRFVQIFYAGIGGYAQGGEYGFIDAGRKKKSEIRGLSLSQLFDKFVEQCERACKKTDSDMLSDDARNLKKMITRTYICDVRKLKYFTQIKMGKEETNIFAVIENLSKYVREENYNTCLEKVLGFFIYLVFNDDCKTSDAVNVGLINQFESGIISEKEIDPIYPYIVSYYSENTDRDEVKRCNYRAYFPAKYTQEYDSAEIITVTLLTEREYTKNTTYYCLPLKYGSTGKWWIEPFMVPTSIFKKILKEENNESHND